MPKSAFKIFFSIYENHFPDYYMWNLWFLSFKAQETYQDKNTNTVQPLLVYWVLNHTTMQSNHTTHPLKKSTKLSIRDVMIFLISILMLYFFGRPLFRFITNAKLTISIQQCCARVWSNMYIAIRQQWQPLLFFARPFFLYNYYLLPFFYAYM